MSPGFVALTTMLSMMTAYLIVAYINARSSSWFVSLAGILIASIAAVSVWFLMAEVAELFGFDVNKKKLLIQSFKLGFINAVLAIYLAYKHREGRSQEYDEKRSVPDEWESVDKTKMPIGAVPVMPVVSAASCDVMNEYHENAAEPVVYTQQDEEALYEIVAAEMAVRKIKKGLWAKAYAQCEGDTNRTKALYIKLRVQALKDEAARMAQPAHLPAVETESERMQPEAPSAPEEGKGQSNTFLDGKPHPWRRFFARVIDNCIAVISMFLLSFAVFYAVPEKHATGLILFLIFFALFAEALFLHRFGTTPAKWLFGIRVVHPDGKLLTLVESLKRLILLYVWVNGGMMLVMLLFLLTFYFYPDPKSQPDIVMVGVIVIGNCLFWGPYLFAYRRLAKTGTTRWDSAVSAVVVHKKWGVFRTIACIVCTVVLIFVAGLVNMLASFSNTQDKDEEQSTQQSYEQSQSQNKKEAAQGDAQENETTEASSGDADVQLNLGAMYALQQDYTKAKSLFEKAAAQGSAEAQYNLGLLYDQGYGVPQDYAQARSWYEKAAVQGNDSAQFNLGLMYARGQGGRQDYAQARQWYERAAAQGHAKAQNNLGVMYHEGEGVQQDYAQARRWFEKAAAKDNADAQYWMGYIYAQGHGVKQDYAQARAWFEKAAAQGAANAQTALDMMNAVAQEDALTKEDARQLAKQAAKGDGRALKALEQTAAQGDADAQTGLGVLYLIGQGVRQDYAQARKWLEKAAAQGNAEAQTGLGVLYLIGQGVRQDYAQARTWLEKAAAQGNAEAQTGLGLMYYVGHGVQKNYAQARYWWEKAAAQGDAMAQFYLGELYRDGQGVRQDYAKAKYWFEKSAAQGDADAQAALDMMNAEGRSMRQEQAASDAQWNVESWQDYAQARARFERAAIQGDADAQFNLGRIYAEGLGVWQDKQAAMAWFGKACNAGLQEACDEYQELEDEGY